MQEEEKWRTIQIRGVAGDFWSLGLLADDEFAVPVDAAHDDDSFLVRENAKAVVVLGVREADRGLSGRECGEGDG